MEVDPPFQFLCLQTVHPKVVVNSCGVIEGYQLYKLEGLEPKSKMLDYLVEYTTNEDPVTQFADTYLGLMAKLQAHRPVIHGP